MNERSSSRSRLGSTTEGECLECREHLPGRLLWPVHATGLDEPQPALLCFACVAVEILRMAAGSLDDAPEA